MISQLFPSYSASYVSKRPPNPCVMCNTHIKWEALLKRADMLNCEYIATGHYANIRMENDRAVISRGLDDLFSGKNPESLCDVQYTHKMGSIAEKSGYA